MQLHRNPASLEGPAGLHNEDSTLADFIPDDSETTPDEAAVHRMLTQDMDQLLYTLSERESEVLRLRYGLEDGTERTLEEVGRVMMVCAPFLHICDKSGLLVLHTCTGSQRAAFVPSRCVYNL